MSPATVTVRPLTGIGQALTYGVPPTLEGPLQVGTLVRIPLGRRTVLGLVTRETGDDEVSAKALKLVLDRAQPFPVVTADLLKLGDWMATYYATTAEKVFEAMVPSAVRQGMTPKLKRWLALPEKRPPAAEVAILSKRAPQQAKLYRFLADQLDPQPVARGALLKRLQMTDAVAQGLIKKGFLQEFVGEDPRRAYADALSKTEVADAEAPTLNDEQAVAAQALLDALAKRRFSAQLLHGVTGSGKTEVYLRAIEQVVAEGGGAIFLVPEVALAPQTVQRLRARLEARGTQVVVWHSHLSGGERHDAWRALATGQAQVAVGARSAIFAPVPNLRLVVVDEEHEPAYKQEEVPRYHGRDVAVVRARFNEAVVVLGSATPSLESLFNVRVKKYEILRLTARVDSRELPLIHLIDMRREFVRGQAPAVFSRRLIELMQDRREKGEQIILFLNRRGYHATVRCLSCGWVAECDHCAVTMTYHRADHHLRCHLCGATAHPPRVCPNCRSDQIVFSRAGTQRIEEMIASFLPGARIARLDTDTMGRKDRFREVLGDFRRGQIDVLVGTQMIAKGLDFPNVTLAALLDADISAHLPDFRADERTFQLLVQVAGRAGRGDRAGEVVVQTSIPHHGAIQFARQQDFDGFAEAELQVRRETQYPPYRHLIHHLFRGKNPEKVEFYAKQWAKKVEEALGEDPDFELRGPGKAPVEKIKDFYRYQIWYLTPYVTRYLPKIAALREAFPWDNEVIEVIDVDAVNLM